MKLEQSARLVLVLLGLVAACVVTAGYHRLMNSLMPVWATCCHLLDMATGHEFPFWLIMVARAIFALVLLTAIALLLRRLWQTGRLLMSLKGAGPSAPSGRLARLCQAARVLPQQVVVLATPVPLAFCCGLLRPRIFLSSGLVEALTYAELKAVLLHEDYHRRRHDPLRALLLDLLATLLFFLPAIAEWREVALTSAELAADRHAASGAGAFSLAGALHKILTHPLVAQQSSWSAAGLSGFSATAIRIAYLVGDSPVLPHFSVRSLVISGAGLMAACLIIQLALV